MSKAELMGCIGTAGKADCEHYLPGARDGNKSPDAMPGGRCMKDSRMVSRMDACPISGKLAKKQTKAEQFGCTTCEYAKHYTVLCCELAGKFASIVNLHECPKTKPQPPTEEELAQKRMAEYGCKDCINYNDSQNGHICKGQDPQSHNRLFKPISMVEVCPDRKTHDNPWSQTFCGGHSIVPAGKERWDYRTLPGDIRAVDYWYDVGGKDVFETTCVNLEDCRKARDRYFENEARKAQETSQEESAPPAPAPPMRILALDVSTKCTGWALREGDKIIEHGSIKATGDDTEKRKEIMRQGVINYCLGESLNCVLMERSFIQHNDPSRIVCEMQGILKNLIHRVGFKLLEPSPTTWRAVCPGSGRCDKVASVEFARLKGYVFESEDEAEAICMALSFGPQLMDSLEKSKKAKEKKKNGKSKGK